MQLHTITELLAISNYRVSHMVVHSDNRLDLILEPSCFVPAVCSGCGHVHNTPVHSLGMIVVEDLPRKRHFILNYFICKITTAISEGINNKIKPLKRMAYGYKDVTYFLLKIHQHCGLLNLRHST